MQNNTTILLNSGKIRKPVFKRKTKKEAVKVRVEKFASSFYAKYGEMMSKLSHE